MAKKNYAYGGKATAVLEWLNTEPDVTDAHIAKHVGCSTSYVHKLRKEMVHVQPTHQVIEIPEEVTRELSGLLGKINAKPGEYIEVEGQVGPNEIDAILDQRGSRYGNFMTHAKITQELKSVMGMYLYDQGRELADDQMEALEMIFHKIGRILNGDPDYADSWIDIAGYAKLVADRLEGKVR